MKGKEMGVDLLDLTFRLEKSLSVKLHKNWCIEAWRPDQRDIQACGVHKCLVQAIQNSDRPVPHSSWHRVQLCICRTCGVSPHKVKPKTWLVRELGFSP